jgi:hypothetical protein
MFREFLFVIHYFVFQSSLFSLVILFKALIFFLVSTSIMNVKGIIENTIDHTKKIVLFQKSAPSILQKSINASKFIKINKEIFASFLYIIKYLEYKFLNFN